MTRTRTIETDRFEVKGTSGRTYTLIERTEQHETTSLSATSRTWEDGMKSYQVIGGGNANLGKDGSFLIVANGESASRA